MLPTVLTGRRRALASLLTACGLFASWLTAARAESPATEFSATNNPNGVWSYGDSTTLGGPLLLYTLPVNLNGLVGWNDGPTSNNPPQILYNGTDSEIDFASLSLDPGELLLHPGPNGEDSLLRFTAPAVGFYRATGSFFGRDHAGTTTDVHLLVNGTPVFNGEVTGYGPGTGPDFDKTVFLAVGGTLDFGVGFGTNGTYFSDSTGLVADVSATDAAQPTAVLTSPPDGITVVAGADLPLAASVDDPDGILSQVQFLLDGAPVGTATAAPFVSDAAVPVNPGSHTIQAVTTDLAGRVSMGGVTTINVIAATATAAPTSAVLTPLAGHSLAAGSSLTLSIGADADAATTLDHVSLYADGALVAAFNADGSIQSSVSGQPTRRDAAEAVGNVFQTPYTLPGTDRFVNMIAVAFDKLGQATVSRVASFHSMVTTDKAPTVGLSGLADGAHVKTGSASTISVDASDPDASNAVRPGRPVRADATSDMQLALLEYYLSAAKIGQATTPPFSFTFTPPAPGKYVLAAVATDGSGLSSVSAPITVEADGPALPTVNLAVGGSVTVQDGAKGIIVVSRTGDTSSALTVLYKTKGAAVAGVDYKTLPGSITIPAGAVKAKLKVKTLAGLMDAGVLKLKVQLLAPTDGSYALGTTAIVKLKLIGQ